MKKLEQIVWDVIDSNVKDLSKEEYLDFLKSMKDDLSIRIEGVEEELEDQ